MSFRVSDIVNFSNGVTGIVKSVNEGSSSYDVILQNGIILERIPFLVLENGMFEFPSLGLYPVDYNSLDNEVRGIYDFAYKIVKTYNKNAIWIIWNCGYNELVTTEQLKTLTQPKLFFKFTKYGTPYLMYKGLELKKITFSRETGVFDMVGVCTVCGKQYRLMSSLPHTGFVCNCQIGHDVFGLKTTCERIGAGKFKITYEDGTFTTIDRADFGARKNLSKVPYVHKYLYYDKRSKVATYTHKNKDGTYIHYIVDSMRFNPAKGVYEIQVHGQYKNISSVIDLPITR